MAWTKEDIGHMNAARDAVVDAMNHLAKIEDVHRAAEKETIQSFSSGLRDWLTIDHNEAGFVPFVRRVLIKVRN